MQILTRNSEIRIIFLSKTFGSALFRKWFSGVFFLNNFIYLNFDHALQHVGSQLPNQISNSYPLPLEGRVLTTRPSWKYLLECSQKDTWLLWVEAEGGGASQVVDTQEHGCEGQGMTFDRTERHILCRPNKTSAV